MCEIEYFTDINPTNQITVKSLQNKYNMEYKIATHIFYNDLYVSKDIVYKHLELNKSFELEVDISEQNDEIKTNTNYDVKFLKSVFISEKYRDIINKLKEYYSECSVAGPFPPLNTAPKKVIFVLTRQNAPQVP